MKIGVATYKEIKNRTLAIAKGEYKPSKDEPKVWLQSDKAVNERLKFIRSQIKNKETQKILDHILAQKNPAKFVRKNMFKGAPPPIPEKGRR